MSFSQNSYRPRVYYLFALGMIAVLAIASYVALRDVTASQETSARLINISGRQRMLSQRIALLGLSLATTSSPSEHDAVRTELNQRITEMNDAHQRLITGDLGDGLTNTLSPDVNALYFNAPLNADAQIKDYLSHATTLLQPTNETLTTDNVDLTQLLTEAPLVLTTLDQIVSQYEIDKKNEVDNIENAELVILIVTLLVLVLDTLLIFRPMETRIHAREKQLNLEIDERKKIEGALRYSETAYRLVISNMPNLSVILYNRDLLITLADGPFLEEAGYIKSEIEGKTIKDILPSASYEALSSAYTATLNGESKTVERDRGDLVYFSQFVPVKDEVGNIVGGMIASLDITRRKRAEDALRASEERFRELADHAPIGIFQIDTDDQYTFVNPRWSHLTGLSIEEGLSRRLTSVIHPDDREDVLKRWTVRKEIDREIVKETRLQKPDGESVWIIVSIMPVHDSAGKIISYIGTITDINQRKQAEQELQESRDFSQNITDATPDLIYIYDMVEQRITYTNHDMHQFFGYTLEAFEAADGRFISNLIHPTDYMRIYLPHLKNLAKGEGHEEIQYRMRDGSGQWRWFYSHDRMLKYAADGSPLQMLGICHDITRSKMAEQQAMELELERESVKMMSEFINSTSLELRTPLSVISTNAYLLSRLDTPEKRQSKLDVINAEINHINRLINDFQIMAALDSNIGRHVESINLVDLITRISDEANTRVMHKQIHFSYQVDPKLPSINGDVTQINNAINHLVDNAIRFTPIGGQISIQSTLEKDVEGYSAVIKITDSGSGISATDIPYIFKPLYKANESRIHDSGGSGMGLPIVQKIIDLHLGSISVDSEPGKGTTFIVSFPIEDWITTSEN